MLLLDRLLLNCLYPYFPEYRHFPFCSNVLIDYLHPAVPPTHSTHQQTAYSRPRRNQIACTHELLCFPGSPR